MPPRERLAQRLANSEIRAKKQDNPGMTKEEQKKIGRAAIDRARATVGAKGKETRITITDREWEAIQAGAISDTQLVKIFRHTDTDEIRQRATPRATTTLSPAKQAKITSMYNNGYTYAEIAKAVGVSTSTISKQINGN